MRRIFLLVPRVRLHIFIVLRSFLAYSAHIISNKRFVMHSHNALPDISQVQPRTAADAPLFAELASVLDKYDARGRFGIMLLHKHFDLDNGEVLLEETDVQGRVQTITPVSESARPNEYIETAWQFDKDGTPEMKCICPERQGKHIGDHIRVGK